MTSRNLSKKISLSDVLNAIKFFDEEDRLITLKKLNKLVYFKENRYSIILTNVFKEVLFLNTLEEVIDLINIKSHKRKSVNARIIYCWFTYFNSSISLEDMGKTLNISKVMPIYYFRNLINAFETNDITFYPYLHYFKNNGINIFQCIPKKKDLMKKLLKKHANKTTQGLISTTNN
jgi:uncharacterized phage-associated protein